MKGVSNYSVCLKFLHHMYIYIYRFEHFPHFSVWQPDFKIAMFLFLCHIKIDEKLDSCSTTVDWHVHG